MGAGRHRRAAFGSWRLTTKAPGTEDAAIAHVPATTSAVVAVESRRFDPAATTSSSSAAAADDAVVHVARLLQHGSLGGTEADGDWGHWIGETPQPAQLRAWVAAQVTALHGAAGAAQVLAVWDHYLALLQTSAGGRVDAADRSSLRRAMAERAAERNVALGLGPSPLCRRDCRNPCLFSAARRSPRGGFHLDQCGAVQRAERRRQNGRADTVERTAFA